MNRGTRQHLQEHFVGRLRHLSFMAGGTDATVHNSPWSRLGISFVLPTVKIRHALERTRCRWRFSRNGGGVRVRTENRHDNNRC